MTHTPRITVLSGSTRTNSSSLAVASELERVYTKAGASASLVAIKDIPADALAHKEIHQPPASFALFAKPVLECDGLVIVTPEYNGGLPGMLKVFIDLLPFPGALMNKPIALVGVSAGNWGALRPIEQLVGIFIYRQAFIYPGHVFIPNCSGSIDTAGRKVTSDETLKRLGKQAEGFVRFVDCLKPLATHAKG